MMETPSTAHELFQKSRSTFKLINIPTSSFSAPLKCKWNKSKNKKLFSGNISRKWHFNFAINLEICWRRKLNNHTLQSSLLFGPCPINIPYILKWNDKLKVPRKIYPKKMLMILKQFNNLLSKYIISTMLKEGQFAYFAIE